MPIKWNALRVVEAADMIEKHISQAVEPLELAKKAAIEARKIANLPQYIDQDFIRFIYEIERVIGGSQQEPIGRFRAAIGNIRMSIPKSALEAEQEASKQGNQLNLI